VVLESLNRFAFLRKDAHFGALSTQRDDGLGKFGFLEAVHR
jgi:hypothetical protein